MAVGSGGAFVYTAVRDDGRPRDTTRRERSGAGAHRHQQSRATDRQSVAARPRWSACCAGLRRQKPGALGRAAPLASGVASAHRGRGLFVASARLLLTAPSVTRARTLAWFTFDGQSRTETGEPGDYWQARISPDDRSVAITLTAPLLRTLDIAVMPSDGKGNTEPLTSRSQADSDPVWAPDGQLHRVSVAAKRAAEPLHAPHAHEGRERRAAAAIAARRDADGLAWRTRPLSRTRRTHRISTSGR